MGDNGNNTRRPCYRDNTLCPCQNLILTKAVFKGGEELRATGAVPMLNRSEEREHPPSWGLENVSPQSQGTGFEV